MAITAKTSKLTPCLWFDTNAEEAVKFYTSVFPESRVITTSHYWEGAPMPKGTVLTITFEMLGQKFMALNGGPQYQFTEAISLMIECDTQAEIDSYWDKLLKGGGQTQACGWLKDRFGLSWQVVPRAIEEWISGPNSARVMQVVMGMIKLDMAQLRAAAEGR